MRRDKKEVKDRCINLKRNLDLIYNKEAKERFLIEIKTLEDYLNGMNLYEELSNAHGERRLTLLWIAGDLA